MFPFYLNFAIFGSYNIKLAKIGLYIIIVFSLFFSNCSKNDADKLPSSDSSKEKKELQQTGNTSGSEKNEFKKSNDSITIETADSKNLSANYYYSTAGKETSQPLVILIHQFRQSKEQWKQDFIDSLISSGFKVLAFDIRGHGNSSKIKEGLTELLADPDQLPKDISAVVKWARKQNSIDSSRIGVIGTSVGGNLALYAELNLGTKTAIAVSNGQKGFEIFTGYNELMMGRPYFPKMKNVLLICGSLDGDHERGQKWISENFLDEPKELKVYTSDKHGMYLIDAYPEISALMISWLKKYL
jgi:dienelactone hydrolase